MRRITLLAVPLLWPALPAAASDVLEFNRDVRPILADHCYECHGPDGAARRANLRLDTRDGATAPRSRGAAIVPGDPDASLLMHRVLSDDDERRMPPPKMDDRLTVEEIDVLRRWIEGGAVWEQHWSFITPRRPPVPATGSEWPRTPIDSFILERLNSEGLAPSPEADPITLMRRAALDLTGMPPTIEEADAFLADVEAVGASDAYERLVDRLLASPKYGEHLAHYWLDAARYGDTHGLHLDNRREMWRWRDWVVDACNANKPFDEFTIEQLAGDLLPEPTTDQLIATGFNRNHVSTSEGGAIDAEYLVKYAADRTDTTGTVWLGLTVGCAQCHDHKFDPVTQEEYYRLFAFFNNVDQRAMDGNIPSPPPFIAAPTPEQASTLDELDGRVTALTGRIDAPMPEVDAAQAEWMREWREDILTRWEVLDPAEFTSSGGSTLTKLDDRSLLAEGENPEKDVYDITARTDATGLRMIRLEALTHPSLPHHGPGRAENANLVLSEVEVTAVSVADPSVSRPLTLLAAAADHEQTNGAYRIANAIDGVVDDTNGWAVEGYNRREDRTAMFVTAEPFGFDGGTELRFELRHESHFKQHAIGRVRLAVSGDEQLIGTLAPSGLGAWHSVGPFPAADGRQAHENAHGPEADADGFVTVDLAATFDLGGDDGTLGWRERPELADAKVHSLLPGTNCATYLYRTVEAPTARTIELSLGSDDAIKIWLNGAVVLDKYVARPVAADQDRLAITLTPGTNHLVMKVTNFGGGFGFYFSKVRDGADAEMMQLMGLLAKTPETLDETQRQTVRRHYRRNHSEPLQRIYDELKVAQNEKTEYEKTLPKTLVMSERMERRPTFMLDRGEYDRPLHEVQPDVPAVFPPLPPEATAEGRIPSRLDLARWLVHPDHPLTARVTVNRIWQQHFGTGLVHTAEDFGTRGAWPSHAKLLDWLARDFVESGWDVKRMHRMIVTSAAYRQASAVTQELHDRDRDNRLLARGPRFRLDAEVIRDQALAVSGLLVDRIGGPPVKPYQPTGLWYDVGYADSNTRNFSQDTGEALYRRSIYTFWKRTSHPPSLAAFDAPNREYCVVRRERTNTALQVLVLMNDPQFVEAARGLGQRTLRLDAADDAARLTYAFRLVLTRAPEADEVELLLATYRTALETYREDEEAARALLGVGDSMPDANLPVAELAAWTNVASVLLCLDEAITKG